MFDNKLTIFTPTYNRGDIIHKCYKSLCDQTNTNFTWLIVDDGSTDNTETVINTFIKENKINIIYIKQKNGGKHVAHNTGVLKCKTELFVCVDSDDYLTLDAVQEIYSAWEKVPDVSDLAGIIALKGISDKEPIGTWMPKNIQYSSTFDLYDKYKFKGDTLLVFKTNILREYLFPVFEGEKFVTEAVVYDLISQKHRMKLINKVLYLCEYLEDGLTRNLLQVHRNNKQGYMHYLLQRIEIATEKKSKYKAVSNYIAGCLRIKSFYYYKKLDLKWLKIITLPRALWVYTKPHLKKTLIKYNLYNKLVK
ncbi:glycosyltransferase family A protein [Mangrovibacillus cuniculi]|uniref:Glycosyltransferase family 2 protein n=1 Tax=Mangrovibacillus cuniculi TaxID=2593652 RepID=A0A7S8HGB9_9BACI|nr:glycosyltransferase family 2 protein [Mangrovibacillus cuniculi]QPC47647.1 glycosyltransferase family 2 protein [Mangrovibacillus cuniculi]